VINDGLAEAGWLFRGSGLGDVCLSGLGAWFLLIFPFRNPSFFFVGEAICWMISRDFRLGSGNGTGPPFESESSGMNYEQFC